MIIQVTPKIVEQINEILPEIWTDLDEFKRCYSGYSIQDYQKAIPHFEAHEMYEHCAIIRDYIKEIE